MSPGNDAQRGHHRIPPHREPAEPGGFTALACTGEGCSATTAEFLPRLRDLVRTSEHGVLISIGCALRPLLCRYRPPGAVLIAGPCDSERRPTGPAVCIGPITSTRDVAEAAAWIAAGRFDLEALPVRLRQIELLARGAAQN